MKELLNLVLLSFVFYSCCTKIEKKILPEIETVNKETTHHSVEIPGYLAFAVRSVIPNSSTFWLLEPVKLESWPDKFKNAIRETICEDRKGRDCQPASFGIHNINDSLDLIIDYSRERSGTSGSRNYVYNSNSGKFICLAVGKIYGIVKSPDFVGFIFQFRYSDQDDYVSRNYESLEEFRPNKVVTRAILTPNSFKTAYEQEVHFNHYKKEFFRRRVE